jgi:2,4-dienoyl-CoA reductase-like NADH-dependent reductase (Old Yellow Enzyme family)
MHMNLESIFRAQRVGPVTATNRLMRSATHESAADIDGMPHAGPMKRIYGDLARGGIGLIVTGHTFVDPHGRAGRTQCGMTSTAHARAWQPILAAVRQETQAPILCQLTYAGRQAFFAGPTPAPNDKRQKLPPPGTPVDGFAPRQLEHVVTAFGEAAALAAEAGFDGVQIHMAHGYFLSECLSGHTNHRDDEWGGADAARRRRLPLAVVDAVRAALGGGRLVAVKLNGSDYLPPAGVEPAEAGQTAVLLAEHGVELIEVSAGMAEAGMKTAQPVQGPEDEGYLLEAAVEVAKRTSVTVASVGGYRTAPPMLKALGEGINMISLCRPLVREPDFPLNLQRNAVHVARCVSCNKCFGLVRGALRCPLDHSEPID